MIQKAMVNVYPIRYRDSIIEFLMIKRATLSYNWQCVSASVGQTMGALDHPKGESPLECAKRELFEETGYMSALLVPVEIPEEFYTEKEEDDGELSPAELQKELKEITFFNFIALIDQPQEPVLNPAEHTDWKWCSYERAYKIIMWAVEKKLLKYIYNYIIKNPLI
ncbi:MAG: NUDIX domain-containing protein [Candidatus Thorarchaeota archaeon]